MSWDPRRPYNDLPLLPPAVELETKAVLKRCIDARAAVAALDQAANLIPNPAVLVRTLPLMEARASSEIENIVTTADELFRHLDREHVDDPATKEALRYREALVAAADAGATLSTRMAQSICSRIKGVEMPIRSAPGTALVHGTSGQVRYTPPVGEARLRDLLANWERFLHDESDLDPLVRLAVGHYQFEAIHPFTDGNGRTGRVLNSLFLVEQELLSLPILYLSRYILRRRRDYYRLLLDVTEHGAWEPWILYIVEGVGETARWTCGKNDAIRDLTVHTAGFVRERLPKLYRRELIDVIFEQPYCRIGHVVEARVAKRQTASVYLKALVEIGVLREVASGRDKFFVHPKLMTLLTEDDDDFEPYR